MVYKKISIRKNYSNNTLKPRLVRIEDEKLLLDWANDPLVRANALNKKNISSETHHTWFNSRLQKPESCKILIIENEKEIPVGQVRIEKKNNKWFIDFSLAKFARGKKIGSKLLKVAITKFKKMGIKVFFAEVKSDNKASCRVFEKNKFEKKTTFKRNLINFIYKNK
tara:strand:+ start:2012 stop:2512 length:501 start_codon:yes stop_codon:yes gene_type:complete